MLETKDYPRLGDVTRDQYQQHLALDYCKWLGCLAENNLPVNATQDFLLRYPQSLGAPLLRKAAVLPGTSGDATWAQPLVSVKPLQEAFLAIARSSSLLGRIPNLRKVPFNTKVPLETTGSSYSWVSESSPKPVSAMGFSSGITLAPTKCLGIVVVSRELVELTVVGMEAALRDTLIGGLTAFTDKSLLDPASTAIAGTRPASLTAGTTAITSTGNYAADVQTLLTAFFAARPGAQNAVLITNAGHAAAIRSMNAGGGVGLPVLVSEAALGHTIALDPVGVVVADTGIDIDISREASVQMDDAPAAPTATTVQISLWQQNLRGFKVERFVNWQAVTGAVKYLAA